MLHSGEARSCLWLPLWLQVTLSSNTTPAVVATTSRAGLTPSGVALAAEARLAGPAFSGAAGTIRLSWGTQCESVAVNALDDSQITANALAALPGLAMPRVDRSYTGPPGVTFKVTFANPGNLPALRVAVDPLTTMVGLYPTVAIYTDADGASNDSMWGPIPADLMSFAVSAPGSVGVDVNGVPSACAHPSGLCTFVYAAAATPNVTLVSPQRLSFNGTEADRTISITGSGFMPNSTVRLWRGSTNSSGGASIDCPVTQSGGAPPS